MTLRTLYSLRIFFRLLRMVLFFFTAVDGAIVVIGLYYREFSRSLLIYAIWTALWILLIMLLSNAIKVVSEKIAQHGARE